MSRIESVDAWEVLDSRGDPTVRVSVETSDGTGRFTVPSGASTGGHEAVEKRDWETRYDGRGVQTAVAGIREELGPAIEGRDSDAQREIDAVLCDIDGTTNLSRLGANAILGVSGAVAHAAAVAQDTPLYAHLPGNGGRLPMPMVNIISGGRHAVGGIAIQDVLVIPIGAESYPTAIESVWRVRKAVRDRILDAGHRPLVADEGGFAPPLDGPIDAFDIIEDGIQDAGFRPGVDMALAVDVASTEFYDAAGYDLKSGDGSIDSAGMVDLVSEWVADHPIISLEDPLSEDDWAGWQALAGRIGESVQLVGDDLIATTERRLRRAIDLGVVDAVLVKPNQAGTLSRTFDVVETADEGEIGVVISARSGETCDWTIADLAVGLDAGQIKIGSLARSERLAKYNRLFEINRQTTTAFASGEPRCVDL